MKNTLEIKKCKNCGTTIKILKENKENAMMICCGEKMQKIEPNSIDASKEKHIPIYEKVEDEIFVTVNHVMEKEHYIQWITLVKENKEETIYLYPEQNAQVRFKYIPGSTIYAYCNKHELWKTDVI